MFPSNIPLPLEEEDQREGDEPGLSCLAMATEPSVFIRVLLLYSHAPLTCHCFMGLAHLPYQTDTHEVSPAT